MRSGIMPDRLFIQLHPDRSAVSWLRRPSQITSRTGPLSNLSGESVGCRVIVFVPGGDVVLLAANVPAMSRQRMSMAVPFALEDQLASDLDSLHFAFGRRSDEEPLPVAVVDRTRMTTWLSRLDEAGIRPDALVPETLALPSMPDAWTILVDTGTARSPDAMDAPLADRTQLIDSAEKGNRRELPHSALVRTGLLTGFAVELANLDVVVRDALIEAGENAPRRIRLLRCSHGSHAGRAAGGKTEGEETPILASVDCQLLEGPRESDKLAALATHFDDRHAINLLQGPYSRETGIGELWRAWRIPIVLTTVWLVVWIGGLLMDIAGLSARSRSLETEIQSVYRQAFPDARKMNNLRTRMARGLGELREAGRGQSVGFLDLLDRIGVYLQSTRNARLTNLYFRSGELELRVEMTDLQAFDRLKDRLIREAGLTVEVLSATTRKGAVMGHLKISTETAMSGASPSR